MWHGFLPTKLLNNLEDSFFWISNAVKKNMYMTAYPITVSVAPSRIDARYYSATYSIEFRMNAMGWGSGHLVVDIVADLDDG